MEVTKKHIVSVIVPVYKAESYLPACIESILNQTYRDIQLILVDDGSPDSCGAICDTYGAKDNRILVIHKENGGVSSARNRGLEHAVGAYVTFCDSDDSYGATWIEALVTALEDRGADLSIGDYISVHEDGTTGPGSRHETGVYEIQTAQERVAYCIQKIFGYQHGVECCFRLFRTDLIRENSIRFCETCSNYAEDLCFSVEYMFYARRIVSIDTVGYRYLVRDNSMAHTSAVPMKLNQLNEVSLQIAARIGQAFSPQEAERYLPVFHAAVMGTEYQKVIYNDQEYDPRAAVAQIRDLSYWRHNTLKVFARWKEMEAAFGKYAARTALVYAYCFLAGDRRVLIFWRNRMRKSE